MFDQNCDLMTPMELNRIYYEMRCWVDKYDKQNPESDGTKNHLSQVLDRMNLDRNVLTQTPQTVGNGNNFLKAIREVTGQNQYVVKLPENSTEYGQSYMRRQRY